MFVQWSIVVSVIITLANHQVYLERDVRIAQARIAVSLLVQAPR